MNIYSFQIEFSERQKVVKISQKIPGYSLSECNKFYTYLGYYLNDSQLCAGEKEVKDNCDAVPGNYENLNLEGKYYQIENIFFFNFAGGSLVAEDTLNEPNPYTYLVGIYSFGFGVCANSGFPGVYTV